MTNTCACLLGGGPGLRQYLHKNIADNLCKALLAICPRLLALVVSRSGNGDAAGPHIGLSVGAASSSALADGYACVWAVPKDEFFLQLFQVCPQCFVGFP